MTIILILLSLGWPLAAWLYWSRRQERLTHAIHAGGWFAHGIRQSREIAELREIINKERRNTGKAEM